MSVASIDRTRTVWTRIVRTRTVRTRTVRTRTVRTRTVRTRKVRTRTVRSRTVRTRTLFSLGSLRIPYLTKDFLKLSYNAENDLKTGIVFVFFMR